MLKIEWVLGLDCVCHFEGDTLCIDYEKWMDLDKDQKKYLLAHNKMHEELGAKLREQVIIAMADDYSNMFRMQFMDDEHRDTMFVCMELNRDGTVSDAFVRNRVDTERFIRCSIKGCLPYKVQYNDCIVSSMTSYPVK